MSMMTIKRSYSASPTPSPSLSPETKVPETPPSKKTKTSSKSPRAKMSSPSNGTWTPEKRAEFMDTVIAAGYRAVNLDNIAADLGLAKRQLVDQLVPNRGGNLRAKAVKAAKGE